ncbi:outer membrane channel protein TolC [Galenea microaerophila]
MKPLNLLFVGLLGTTSLTVQAGTVGLSQVYQMAAEHDATLAKARAQYEADQKIERLAQAPLMPQVSAGGAWQSQNSSIKTQYDRTSSVNLTVNQSLYQRGNWLKVEQAKHQVLSAKYAYQNAEQDLIERVVDAYFQVLIAQQDLALAKTKELADKTQWDKVQTSANVGLASNTDVLQAKSSYDLSKSDRINAQAGLDIAVENLAKLTGQPLTDLKTLRSDISLRQFDTRLDPWLNLVETQNFSVLQLKNQVVSAQKQIQIEKSNHFWPQVGLQASLQRSWTHYDSPSNDVNADNASVSVSVTVPLYEGGAVLTQVDQARAKLKVAQQALRETEESIKLQTRNLVHSIQRGQALVVALREAVKSNDAFFESAEEGYRVGTQSLLEVLTARTGQFKARRDLTSALHSLVLNQLKLKAVVGQLTPEVLAKYDALFAEEE